MSAERTYDDVREQRQLICQVPCRQCGEEAGDPCRTPSGHPVAPHGPRRDDAARAGVWAPGGAPRQVSRDQ